MERIDDKLDRQGRIFTDGAGKISRKALKEVSYFSFLNINSH